MRLVAHKALAVAAMVGAAAGVAPTGGAHAQALPGDPRPPAILDRGAPVAPIRRAAPGPGAAGSGEAPRLRRADEEPRETEPVAPQDGVPEPPPPAEIVDGLDPTLDTRPEEDRQAFSPPEPAVGYDPNAFSIEPDPLDDRRPARLARLDPFVPVGIRIGSFTLFPEAEVAGAAFNNLLRSSTDRRSDIALEARPQLRLVSNWAVHAIELGARGLASFHNELPSEDDRAWTLEARGRLDVTRRTNVEAGLTRDVRQESRGTINAPTGGNARGDVTTDRASVAFNHRFNRLSVQLRGAVTERDFSATEDAGSVLTSNADRDQSQGEAAVRATWSFKPELALFGEVATDARSFRAASRSDGLKRDSSGERYRAGISFGTTGQIVRGEVAVGALEQRFDDGRLPAISGVIVDANLAWRVTGLTSLIFTARTDVGESTVAGSGGALTRQAGVEVRHAFRRHLVGSAGVAITRADYAGIDLVEQDVTTSLGLEYFLSREVTLFGRYQHIDFATTSPGGDYTADEVRIGVRVRR